MSTSDDRDMLLEASRALSDLIAHRRRAFGLEAEEVRRLGRALNGDFSGGLSRARSSRERLAIGLLWAEELVSPPPSTTRLDSALFRYGHHLRASASSQPRPADRLGALRAAAAEALEALKNPPRQLIVTLREATMTTSEAGWNAELGCDPATWRSAIDRVRQAIATGATAPPSIKSPPQERIPIPAWISVGPLERASLRLLELTPWPIKDSTLAFETMEDSLAKAYRAFVTRDYQAAARLSAPARECLGSAWGPNESSDGLRLFAWLRAIPIIAELADEPAPAARTAITALELLQRTADEQFEAATQLAVDVLSTQPSGDHVADLDWSAIRFRLCRILGHEEALADLDNATKSILRNLWKQRFRRLSLTGGTTIDVLNAIDNAFSSALTELHQLTATATLGMPVVKALGSLAPFLDLTEQEIAQRMIGVLQDAGFLRSGIEITMAPLRRLHEAIDGFLPTLYASGSLLLQESALPILRSIQRLIDERTSQLSTVGGPSITMHLLSDRLPLLAAPATSFALEVLVRNSGTLLARNVNVTIEVPAEFSVAQRSLGAGDLPPGAERRLRFEASTNTSVRTTAFSLECDWEDEYDREGGSKETFHAEAQRESRWTSIDRNPFQLSSIEDPERLIGRDEYIRRFLDISRSGGSMYVTGLKRVGKTSLARVALKLLEREDWLTVYMPLGRALGPEPAAADIVFGVLEKLEDAARGAFPASEIPPVEARGPNFSRQADRWLSQLRRTLPHPVFAAIAIDDFDELPHKLRYGAEADALFLFLRTLVDESWLSLTFIGSEVLPTILAQQSQRLNQVDPMQIENFGSREETAELLQRPSSDRFDWDDEAVNVVHSLTSGNPYYATLLGSRVWGALRERSRTLAQASDVWQAARSLADTENQSHFMHLWADDPLGLETTSPRAIRSSAVLRSLARCGSSGASLVDREEVVKVANSWIPGATAGELHSTCSSLVRRGILAEAESNQLSFRVPIVAMWLRAAGARHLDELYRESDLAQVGNIIITASDYVSLSHRTYQGRQVSELRIQQWVEQFGDSRQRYVAFQVLRRACREGFFSQERVQSEVVPTLTTALLDGPLKGRVGKTPNGYLTDILLVDHGQRGTSAPAFIRSMLGPLRLAKDRVVPIGELESRLEDSVPAVILILDEFAGTGRQLGRAVRAVEPILEQRAGADWPERTTIVVGVGVVADGTTVKAIETQECEAVAGKVLGPRVRVFDPDAQVFDSDADREFARDLFAAIGRSLGSEPPLGFGNQGLVAVFESNCPNNSLPALWKRGRFGGKDWQPIFERLESRAAAEGSE